MGKLTQPLLILQQHIVEAWISWTNYSTLFSRHCQEYSRSSWFQCLGRSSIEAWFHSCSGWHSTVSLCLSIDVSPVCPWQIECFAWICTESSLSNAWGNGQFGLQVQYQRACLQETHGWVAHDHDHLSSLGQPFRIITIIQAASGVTQTHHWIHWENASK